ncbi:hypothetical protein V5O48_000168 [Marasmius crinis-equi]|uniref:MYND-type domain-containing protein n=1 Tax=Marasmius crinis-equi TaxID=585013 RepID=A0ABR3G271_9AGAR
MSKVTFNGKEYDVKGLAQDTVGLAEELAKNAKIIEPLPQGVDLTAEDDRKIRQQIVAIVDVLPRTIVTGWWNAFIAQYLPSLIAALKSASLQTQKQYISTLIQILSLLPDPKESAYLRRFLRNPDLCAGVPTLIARHFVDGLNWKTPGGPGHICTLIIHTIHWCDASLGDDKKASIDHDVRVRLRDMLEGMTQLEGHALLGELQRVEIERLCGLLGAVEHLPGDQYARSTRDYLEGQVDMCERFDCPGDGDASLRCSKCKCARYCGKECQVWHWKNGHKLNCFEPVF